MTAPQDIRLPGWSPTGLLAGRYELDGLLGSGGAAEVFRGRDRRLGRPVAVKVFRPDAGLGMEDRFEDEALLLARLEHAGLVTVYDIGRHEGRSFLVMQLVEGRTLRQCAAGAAMDPHRVAEIGTGLADTLAHVHAAGVMHCDVKPSNILLDAGGRPYLTDFGISRPVDATAPTGGGALVGTAAYLAPEQVRGERVEQPADVYALGLVLLECLKGRLEYPGAPLESAVARLHRPPDIPAELPLELHDLLREMTSPEPGERPDARDCAERLEGLRESIRPGQFPLLERESAQEPADRRSPAGPLAAAASAVATDPDDTRHEHPPAPPATGMRRRRGGALAAAGAAMAMTVLGVTLSGAESAGGSGSDPAAVREAPRGSGGEKSAPPASPAGSAGPSRAADSAGSRATPGRSAADPGHRQAAAEDAGTGKAGPVGEKDGPERAAGPDRAEKPGKARGKTAGDKGGGRRGPA